MSVIYWYAIPRAGAIHLSDLSLLPSIKNNALQLLVHDACTQQVIEWSVTVEIRSLSPLGGVRDLLLDGQTHFNFNFRLVNLIMGRLTGLEILQDRL